MADREKVIKGLHDARRYLEDKEWSDRGASPHIDSINDALALLKEQEAKHGKWLESKILEDCLWVCSECEFPSEAFAAPMIYKYCPNCGVKMDRR